MNLNKFKKLDSMFHSMFKDKQLKQMSPIEIGEGDNITIFSSSDSPFFLRSSSGHFKITKPSGEASTNGAVVVNLISYSMSLKYLKNKALFLHNMSLLVNSMLAQATKALGSLEGREYTFKRAETAAGYFRELGEAAAIELRLYVAPLK